MRTKLLTTFMLMAIVIATPAWSQRKRAAAKRPTSTSSPAKTAAKASSGKWAVINLDESEIEFLEQDDKRLYFKYEYDDPNVYAIDKKTGDISMIIKYKPNYDDDALDMNVTGIGSFNDTLYVATKGARIYRYNGSDLGSSVKLLESPKSTNYYVRFTFSADGQQMAARGKSYSGNAFVAQFKRDSGKGVRGYKKNHSYRMLIDPQHRLWTQSLGGVDIVTEYSADATAAASYTTKDGTFGTKNHDLGDQALCYVPETHTVLVASGRKVYASTDSTVNWQEVAKAPSDCPARYINILVSNGRQTYGITDDVDNRILCWENGLNNAPTIMSQIKTDIERDNMFAPLWATNGMPIVHQTMIDRDGNLYMFCEGKLWIYNPQGIKGFSNARGKYVEHHKQRN